MSNWIKPQRLRLEASSLCQLKCPSCPNANEAINDTIGKGYLRARDFIRLLDQNAFIKEIELSNYGEIFLNPDLISIIKAAHKRRVALYADNGVNLNFIHPEQLEGLVRYRVRSMTCSLDGASKETYGKYRINGNFDQVISNIRTINKYKKQYGSPFPTLTWQFVIFGHNEHEIRSAKKLAEGLGMHFILKLSWDDCFSPVHQPTQVRRETGFASRKEYYDHHGLDIGHRSCTMLWEQPQINWNGKVLGCSRNFWGDFGGNAFSDGLLNCLNSPEMLAARRMLVGMRGGHNDVPCATCQIYQDRLATGRFINRGLPMRLMRWTYWEMRKKPWVRTIRNHMVKIGL